MEPVEAPHIEDLDVSSLEPTAEDNNEPDKLLGIIILKSPAESFGFGLDFKGNYPEEQF